MQEIVWHTGLSRKTIHNYAAMGLIREAAWTPGGHRLFDVSVFARLADIERLKATCRLEEIRSLLAAIPAGRTVDADQIGVT
jgi:DNA-binding transcriptional MerR regulator